MMYINIGRVIFTDKLKDFDDFLSKTTAHYTKISNLKNKFQINPNVMCRITFICTFTVFTFQQLLFKL